jgi:hypothetical protein
MAFGPDGNLYISGGTFEGILASDATTRRRAFIDFFANTGSDSYVLTESRLVPTTTSTSPLRTPPM